MSKGSSIQSDHRRVRVVWTSLIAASTVVCGLLLLSQRQHADTPVAMTITAVPSAPATALSRGGTERAPAAWGTSLPGATNGDRSIAPRNASLEPGQWSAIVIHHSGSVAGSAESIGRQHVADGLAGLGHHFIIGNGNGMGDGAIHVGYRWDCQLPGAHLGTEALRASSLTRAEAVGTRPVGLSSDELRHHSVSVCLVGHGDRREFTPRQMRELLDLVVKLQRELGISRERVFLASDFQGMQGPGAHFESAWLESQLIGAAGIP